MCQSLKDKGIPTVAVKMPNWHWLPSLGGRSARPILERIDYTVQHVIAHFDNNNDDEHNNNNNDINDEIVIPPYDYSLWDLYQDFRDNPGGAMKVGGSSRVEFYPDVEPKGKFQFPIPTTISNANNNNNNNNTSTSTSTKKKKKKKKKIALIGHSAGGWISRVYLSSSLYGGKSYDGYQYIHSLVTLGTPHANAPGPAFDGISWINKFENERERRRKPRNKQGSGGGGVRSLSVGGTGFMGGEWGSLTKGAYSFCCPDQSDGTSYDGDGVTPLFSALLMPNSDSLIIENVTHFCWSDENVWGGNIVAPELTKDHKDNNRQWYGSSDVVDQWASFIINGSTSKSKSKSSSKSKAKSKS